MFPFESAKLVVGLIFVVLWPVTYIVYQSFFSPLANIPGPFLAKLTKIWRAYITKRGQFHRDLIALHKIYGPVVRLAPNELSVADPAAFREIYKAGNKFIKGESHSALQGSRPFDLFNQRSERIHAEQRRLVNRAYSMDSMAHLEPAVDDVIRSLLLRLDEKTGKYFDFGAWMQYFAFDVIGAVSFSRPFGFVESGDDNGTFERIKKAMSSIVWLMQAAWLFRLHQKLMPYIGNWLAANDRNGYFFQVANEEIKSRRDRGGDNKDIMAQLFDVQKTKPELIDTYIAMMLTSNVFAGSDTTAASLRAIFICLLNHPDKYRKLMEELTSRQSSGLLSSPIPTSKEAKACPYLQAVIYEAQRLYPAFGLILDREVPATGLKIGHHYIPPKTQVGSSAYVINRVVEVWGDDANEFRPERWFDKEREGDYKRFFFTFGGGSRTCIGINLAWLEIEKVVASLLIRYDMKLKEPSYISEECGGVVFIEGLQVSLSRRKL